MNSGQLKNNSSKMMMDSNHHPCSLSVYIMYILGISINLLLVSRFCMDLSGEQFERVSKSLILVRLPNDMTWQLCPLVFNPTDRYFERWMTKSNIKTKPRDLYHPKHGRRNTFDIKPNDYSYSDILYLNWLLSLSASF